MTPYTRKTAKTQNIPIYSKINFTKRNKKKLVHTKKGQRLKNRYYTAS